MDAEPEVPAGGGVVPARRPAPVEHEVLDVVRDRWSARAIDPAAGVAREQVARLLEAARWAPSSGNAQPWRYVVFDDTVPAARARARRCLRPRNAWAWAAPVLLVSAVQRCWPDSDEPNPSALHDVGAASMALCLQAVAEGLVCHQMAGFDRAAAREVCGLPSELDPVAFIAVGRPGRLGDLEPSRQRRELRDRRRRPISGTAFVGGCAGPGFAV
ncbi:MAG TPA: nitroreductase family protein [Euzebyales bacterium]|nr:nitroreductase family protein [Euzebyales bacterium]